MNRNWSKHQGYPIYQGLPGSVKVFPGVSHSTGHTETLADGATGQVHELMLLQGTQNTQKCLNDAGMPLVLCLLLPIVWNLRRLSGSPRWSQRDKGWAAPSPSGSLLPPTWNRELEQRGPAEKTTSHDFLNPPREASQLLSLVGQRRSHLRHDEAVIVKVPRIVVAILHGVEKQHRHDLCHAAAWCRVSGRPSRVVKDEKNPKCKIQKVKLL